MSEICDYIPEHHNARIVRRVFGKFESAVPATNFITTAAGSRITILSISAVSSAASTLTIQGCDSAGAANASCSSSDYIGAGSTAVVTINLAANNPVNLTPPEGLGLFNLPDGNGMRITTAGTTGTGFFSISYIVSKINSTLNMV